MLSPFLLTLLSVVLGGVFGYLLRTHLAERDAQSAERQATQRITEAHTKEADILRSAKTEEQTILLQAKEKALAFMTEAQKELQEKQKLLDVTQERLLERQRHLDDHTKDLEEKKTALEQKNLEITQEKLKAENLRKEQEETLTKIAGLSHEQAREKLFSTIEEDEKEALLARMRKAAKASEEELESRARKVLALAMQRFVHSHVVDATLTYVELPSEDMKGRIIGKEGRNIKALEHHTGCEFIVDDTPGTISISGFSPVRRQVAKRALEVLMKDGRIQPARIEDAIKEAKQELAKEMKQAGEDALYELGIPVQSIDPKLVAILGRLKFRTSYGQNVLQHSLEVARIAGLLGEELGIDTFSLKKGGLFHDIGKAVDHDMQGAHPQIGYTIMKKFGFPEELCYQSIAHHEDRPKTLEGVIVKVADAISGARPGARRNSIEEYLQRLQNLEHAALSFPGVEKAYAIQAGREVRVFVEPHAINDIQAYRLAKDLAQKIEKELTYPGEVKITVIREKRVIEFAR